MTNAALLLKGDHSKSDRNDASDSGTHDPMEKKKKINFSMWDSPAPLNKYIITWSSSAVRNKSNEKLKCKPNSFAIMQSSCIVTFVSTALQIQEARAHTHAHTQALTVSCSTSRRMDISVFCKQQADGARMLSRKEADGEGSYQCEAALNYVVLHRSSPSRCSGAMLS